ncbi:3-hydroxyacyl-ACP dehydratase FabZ family protein [Nocardia sp. NPDC056000]|uniref:3-hydroxyacyl-ACP dehydratase FabZ family protein n=1 Tax=Nocardia sp. NPDC056000 TaxID=3345674 RepID=UPI0035DD3D47
MNPAWEPILDGVLLVEPGQRAVTVRNIPATLAIFDSHFPRFPVLPGVLLLDSMIETAKYVVGEPGPAWQASEAGVVRFRHFVQPGDRVIIEATLTTAPGTFKVQAKVGDRVVATCRSLRLSPVEAVVPV